MNRKATREVILNMIHTRIESYKGYSADEQDECVTSLGDPVEMFSRALEARDWHREEQSLRALLKEIEDYEQEV